MARVVVLEDDSVVRHLVVRILEMSGHSVQAFEDASFALKEVGWDDVDLLISDLMMPLPGDDAVRALRARGIRVPAIIMSGQLEETRLNGLDIQGTVAKPFKLSELMQAVNAIL